MNPLDREQAGRPVTAAAKGLIFQARGHNDNDAVRKV
jgi:hypothetical protein